MGRKYRAYFRLLSSMFKILQRQALGISYFSQKRFPYPYQNEICLECFQIYKTKKQYQVIFTAISSTSRKLKKILVDIIFTLLTFTFSFMQIFFIIRIDRVLKAWQLFLFNSVFYLLFLIHFIILYQRIHLVTFSLIENLISRTLVEVFFWNYNN